MLLYPFGKPPVPIDDFLSIEPYNENLIKVTFKDGTYKIGEFIR